MEGNEGRNDFEATSEIHKEKLQEKGSILVPIKVLRKAN